MTGGSILTLVNLFNGLLDKHVDEDVTEDDKKVFPNNIVSATSVLVKLECGWNEIQSDHLRYQTSSTILSSLDSIGYQFAKSAMQRRSQCSAQEEVFSADNVELVVRTLVTGSDDLCSVFSNPGSSGSICLPQHILTDLPCSVHVASAVDIESQKSQIFPATFATQPNTTWLGVSLLGLTINDGNTVIDISEDLDPIVVTFVHEDDEVWVLNNQGANNNFSCCRSCLMQGAAYSGTCLPSPGQM